MRPFAFEKALSIRGKHQRRTQTAEQILHVLEFFTRLRIVPFVVLESMQNDRRDMSQLALS